MQGLIKIVDTRVPFLVPHQLGHAACAESDHKRLHVPTPYLRSPRGSHAFIAGEELSVDSTIGGLVQLVRPHAIPPRHHPAL
ncbi:hypothetical protein E2C01_015946 [Portunus trituberculatus]|uniref:Uncharacterized protein n=1 Tax=Portunus trituberculatus TaxID=210409 RepID=A0A5B7DP94_PORTR|nr:hypothetical protein [Portunus trituberculatus]